MRRGKYFRLILLEPKQFKKREHRVRRVASQVVKPFGAKLAAERRNNLNGSGVGRNHAVALDAAVGVYRREGFALARNAQRLNGIGGLSGCRLANDIAAIPAHTLGI